MKIEEPKEDNNNKELEMGRDFGEITFKQKNVEYIVFLRKYKRKDIFECQT